MDWINYPGKMWQTWYVTQVVLYVINIARLWQWFCSSQLFCNLHPACALMTNPSGVICVVRGWSTTTTLSDKTWEVRDHRKWFCLRASQWKWHRFVWQHFSVGLCHTVFFFSATGTSSTRREKSRSKSLHKHRMITNCTYCNTSHYPRLYGSCCCSPGAVLGGFSKGSKKAGGGITWGCAARGRRAVLEYISNSLSCFTLTRVASQNQVTCSTLVPHEIREGAGWLNRDQKCQMPAKKDSYGTPKTTRTLCGRRPFEGWSNIIVSNISFKKWYQTY